jgi:hypothetical protein
MAVLNMKMSSPTQPVSVSAPAAPLMKLSPELPTITLAKALPASFSAVVALASLVVRDSTSTPDFSE